MESVIRPPICPHPYIPATVARSPSSVARLVRRATRPCQQHGELAGLFLSPPGSVLDGERRLRLRHLRPDRLRPSSLLCLVALPVPLVPAQRVGPPPLYQLLQGQVQGDGEP